MALQLESKRLVKHAEKYGTDGVMEAAIEADFTHAQLCELLTSLDEIDAAAARARRFDTPKKHRLTVEKRVDRLLGIPDEQEEA